MALSARLQELDAPLVIVGDQKGPDTYDLPGTIFLDLATQIKGRFNLSRALPVGHYSRKNVGYLEAVARGANCIFETDDDNRPLPLWHPRARYIDAHRVSGNGWINVYRCFSRERIWPRGFPLDELAGSFQGSPAVADCSERIQAPIQQGLANNSPDVDAIWRLILDAPFDFESGPSILIPAGAWCPFNSQCTWWWPEVYPLLYLPSYCSFRMTDIWRSFIAQRCLWELDCGVVFHAPEVIQDRNPHDLMRDFNDEIPGYQRNRDLASTLENLALRSGEEHVSENLRLCYAALIECDFFPTKELELVDLWLKDLANVCAA